MPWLDKIDDDPVFDKALRNVIGVWSLLAG
jgi:hypothetical protein